MERTTEYRAEVGRQLAELRAKRGLTAQQVADLSGVNRVNITKIERGAYNVSVDILGRVCDALGARLRIEEGEERAAEPIDRNRTEIAPGVYAYEHIQGDSPRKHLGTGAYPADYTPQEGDIVVFDEDIVAVFGGMVTTEDGEQSYCIQYGVNTAITLPEQGVDYLGYPPGALRICLGTPVRPATEEEKLFLRYAFADTKASCGDCKVYDWADFENYCKNVQDDEDIR